VKLINTNGMAFIGPGSEWFWTALQFIALAITFYAIYRQLRGQQEQMRESTKLLRSQAHYNALRLHQRPEEMVIEIDGMAGIVLDGLATPDALGNVAWFRFSNHMFPGFNAWEYTYYQHLDDSIPKELWVGVDVFYRDLVQTKPGCARFWSENQTSFDEPFRSYVTERFTRTAHSAN
jgi:hypothetical protein